MPMKVAVRTPAGTVLELGADDSSESIMMIKILIGSKDESLGSEMRLWYDGQELTDDDATLEDIKYIEGAQMVLSTDGSVPLAAFEPTAGLVGGKGEGKGKSVPLNGRAGAVPTTGFTAVQITVSGVSNAKTNGLYVPAAPHKNLPVWYKAPSDEEPQEGESKDRGERAIYYSERQEKWFIGDELDAGGFAFTTAWGRCAVPPQTGWNAGACLEFRGETKDGDLNAALALAELTKLSNVEPWADQETCYSTMLKVLGNIASNPGEAKFCSIKVDNAAIQNKILKHDGARGFLEAVGFREAAGVLTLPQDRHGQAVEARDLLQGFATEASYRNIRKERHAKAAEEAKKESSRPKRYANPSADDAPSGQRFGRDRGPQRGGG